MPGLGSREKGKEEEEKGAMNDEREREREVKTNAL